MYRVLTYSDVCEFNDKQAEATEKGFNVRSIDYNADQIFVLWERQIGQVLKDDESLAGGWPRPKFIIRTYVDPESFNDHQMPGFAIRDLRNRSDGIYALWYTSVYPGENKATDAAQYRAKWERSARFKESPVCPHTGDGVRRRRLYQSDRGLEYLCAICGESFTWDEGICQ